MAGKVPLMRSNWADSMIERSGRILVGRSQPARKRYALKAVRLSMKLAQMSRLPADYGVSLDGRDGRVPRLQKK